MPAHPSSRDPSTRALRYLTGQLVARRLEIGHAGGGRQPAVGRSLRRLTCGAVAPTRSS